MNVKHQPVSLRNPSTKAFAARGPGGDLNHTALTPTRMLMVIPRLTDKRWAWQPR